MLAAAIVFWPQRPSQSLTRFRIRPESMSVSFVHSVDLSPDGRTIVYVSEHDGSARLYRRSLGGLERTEIHAADDIRMPFFRPTANGLDSSGTRAAS